MQELMNTEILEVVKSFLESDLGLTAIAIVAAFVCVFVVSKIIAKRPSNGTEGETESSMGRILFYLSDIVDSTYDAYKLVGGIDEMKYRTDEKYRSEVIETILGIICDICEKNTIVISDAEERDLKNIATKVANMLFSKYQHEAANTEEDKAKDELPIATDSVDGSKIILEESKED